MEMVAETMKCGGDGEGTGTPSRSCGVTRAIEQGKNEVDRRGVDRRVQVIVAVASIGLAFIVACPRHIAEGGIIGGGTSHFHLSAGSPFTRQVRGRCEGRVARSSQAAASLTRALLMVVPNSREKSAAPFERAASREPLKAARGGRWGEVEAVARVRRIWLPVQEIWLWRTLFALGGAPGNDMLAETSRGGAGVVLHETGSRRLRGTSGSFLKAAASLTLTPATCGLSESSGEGLSEGKDSPRHEQRSSNRRPLPSMD